MQKKATKYTALAIVLSIAIGGIYLVSAQTEEENSDPLPFFDRPRIGFGGPMFGELDEELMEEIRETIQGMKDDEASPEEIHEYVQEFLEKNGIEPQMPEYSEEELEALQQLRADVQAYASKRAEELGLELPETGFFGGRGMRPRGFKGGCGVKGPQED